MASGDEKGAAEVNASLKQELVGSEQLFLDEAEAKLSKLSIHQDVAPLAQEAVWFKQQYYESAETFYHMVLAGTANLTVAPGKRTHGQDSGAQSKKQKHDVKDTADFWNKKFKTEGASWLKTVKNIKARLEELEKNQQRKSQIIKDAASRIAAAAEACQTQLSEDLAQSAWQINVFKALLSEVEDVIDKTVDNPIEKKEENLEINKKYYRKLTDRLTKLRKDMNSCLEICNCYQPDVTKSDVNRIVGQVSKLGLIKKSWNSDLFAKRKEVIAKNIKSLLKVSAEDGTGAHSSDSESSLEGSCSVSSDENEKNQKPQSGKSNKSRKVYKTSKHSAVKSNRNNANNAISGRNKTRLDSTQTRPNLGQKRNAQGVQNKSDKRPDLFQFRGVSHPSAIPFLHQPGLLGPRPNIFPLQGANMQSPFSPFMTAAQKQRLGAAQGSLSAGFGNSNFNFSGTQNRASALNYAQNPTLSSMRQQARGTQIKQELNKGGRKSDRSFGARPGFAYSPQTSGGYDYFQRPQTGLMGNYPFRGDDHGNLEQQLNEIAYKMQQMQFASSHNLKFQQLMQETERLRHLVAQNPRPHQQQDRYQQQFQLLINSFMQQQQQQQFQAPQTKMARAVQHQPSQKQQQQQHNRHQQYKKRKQQQNKVQQVKQEPQKQSSEVNPQSEKSEQVRLSAAGLEAVLQNGEGVLTLTDQKIISWDSKVTKIGTFSPQAPGDKHRTGISSIVVMESIGCVVVVDIINSCLKLYNVSGGSSGLSHHLVTRLELSRPYYMGKLNKDKILVSREGQILTLIRVSDKRLQFQQDIKTESQYYGLGYVTDNVVVCAAFTDNRIDILSIKDGAAHTAILLAQCKGPELVTAVPSTGCILYLERVLSGTVHLLGVSQQGTVAFSINLESSSPEDVWSVAAVSDKIVCSNKQSGKIKLYSANGIFLTDMIFPPGDVNQPFAMAFHESGIMYIANDSAWDKEYSHYVTTEINVFSFS